MTKNKRFEYIEATDWVDEHIIDCSTEPHFEYYFLKGATEKLNELHNKYIDEYTLRETLQLELQRVEEENKELKNKINTYKSANKLQQETIRLLREDNGLINITNVELFKLEDEDD